MPGFLQDFFGEFVGEIELIDDRQEIDAGFSQGAEDLNEDGFSVIGVTGKPQHFDDDFFTGLRPFGSGISDIDGVGESGSIDMDNPPAFFFEIDADEIEVRPLENFDDSPASFLTWADGAAFGDRDEDFVTRLSVPHRLGGDENVFIPIFFVERDQKARAGCGPLDDSLNGFGASLAPDQPFRVDLNFFLFAKSLDCSSEFREAGFRNSQNLGHNGHGDRFVLGAFEDFE